MLIDPVLRYAASAKMEDLQATRIAEVVAGFRLQDVAPDDFDGLEQHLIRPLQKAWGNRFWAAKQAYLRAVVAQVNKTKGPILECGSGLSTLLLGAVLEGSGRAVFALEHHPGWYDRVSRVAQGAGLAHLHFILAPLISHGSYTWYDVPQGILPDGLELVICDGPPNVRGKGGRYGVLPVLKKHLAPNGVLLLDDARRRNEKAILERWEAEFGVAVERVAGERFATVRVHREAVMPFLPSSTG